MNAIRWRYVIAAMLLMLGYGIAWYTRAPEIPPGVTVEAKPAREVAKEETVPLIVTLPVQVYKPATKSKLGLPAAVASDAGRHVVASSKVKPDERPHTITTVLDAGTGKFETYDRTDPLPWIAVDTRTEIGLYGGYKGTEPAIRLEGRQSLLQVKALHVGAVASVDVMRGETDTFIGVGLWARW